MHRKMTHAVRTGHLATAISSGPAAQRFDRSHDHPGAGIWMCPVLQVGLQQKDIINCALSREGEEIQLEAYAAMSFLSVPATGVPWIVVNGRPSHYLRHSLAYYLCREFDVHNR